MTLPIEGPVAIGPPMQAIGPTFMLARKSQRLDPRINAFRSDLADIALAGRLFVSHFAAPIIMTCTARHTAIKAEPDGDQTSELLENEAFAVLDLSCGWAWGWSDHDHYVGYVRAQDVANRPAVAGSKNGSHSLYGTLPSDGDSDVHDGFFGSFSKRMPACSGERPPFLRLQGTHEHTTFSQLVRPPCERGVTWSRFKWLRANVRPQYWQVKPSRR